MTKEEEPMTKEEDREQWIVAQSLAGTIMGLNALFCDGGPAESESYRTALADALLSAVGGSRMALEDAMTIISCAIERA